MASALLVSSSLSFLVICDKSDLLQDIPTQLVADVLGRVKKGGVLGRDGTEAVGDMSPAATWPLQSSSAQLQGHHRDSTAKLRGPKHPAGPPAPSCGLAFLRVALYHALAPTSCAPCAPIAAHSYILEGCSPNLRPKPYDMAQNHCRWERKDKEGSKKDLGTHVTTFSIQ